MNSGQKPETAYDSEIVAHWGIGTVISLMIARRPREPTIAAPTPVAAQPRHRMRATGDQDSATLPCQADSSVRHVDHRPFFLRLLAR
jgi:hypothetical protein